MFSPITRITCLLGICLGLAISTTHAELQSVWQIGVDGDPFASGYDATAEFASENYINDAKPGKVTRLPSDPLYVTNNPTADDDFYGSGNYPVGFNGLVAALTVPNQEPNIAWERALTDGDRTNRVHFILTAAQTNKLTRLRLSFELVWGGSWNSALTNNGEGLIPHDITVRFRNASGTNTILFQQRIDRDRRIVLDFPATNVFASAGPNTIEFIRTGPFAANIGYWIQFDYLKLEANTNAFADADGDGLPRWWEEDHFLNDTNAADALVDLDNDARTALQEYNGGVNSTDPRRTDSDGDGLNDGAEAIAGTNPNAKDSDADGLSDADEANLGTNPLNSDTDADGFSDAWEARVGSNPSSNASMPTTWRGSIGLHFYSENDLEGTLGTNEVVGIIPQTRWNETVALRGWNRPTGSKADFISPLTNRIVRCDGYILTNLTVNWTADASDASDNHRSPEGRLMDGYLSAYNSGQLALTISNIPFASYDLYVIVGGTDAYERGRLRLNNNSSNDRYFVAQTTAPQTNFVEIKPGLTNFQGGNFTYFTNLTSAVAKLSVTNIGTWSVGICAVQIVDRSLDADASGIPDWYENQFALQPASAALAAADSDGDGLSNLQEYQRRTHPHKTDSDGDGLNDSTEVSLGTNPSSSDTDGDGLSDFAEVNGDVPSNAKLADSNGNGLSDLEDLDAYLDPKFVPTNAVIMPFLRTSPRRWEWTLENVQFVWNHNTGVFAPNIWDEDQLVTFAVINDASTDWRTLGMELRYYNGALTHLFHSEPSGGFSSPGNVNSSIWESDYGNPPADLKSKLGFSGYGPADISDRLRFRLFAQRTTGTNLWTVTFEIRNQTSNTVVVTRSFTNCIAAATVDAGTAIWRDYNDNTNRPVIEVHQGVQMFMTTNPLASFAAFAPYKDTDKDGMPNAWEISNLFNTNSAADATQDADSDGLNNRAEYLAGTNPRLADTDGDGINDGLESQNSANPLLNTSRPEMTGATWPTGVDLDNNGLPDAWEVRFRAFNLPPNSDADADGSSNAQEAKWGTDPFDANSVPRMTSAQQTNDFVVNWPYVLGKDQRVFTSSNLVNWTQTSLVPLLAGDSASLRFTNRTKQTAKEFYRVSTDDKDSDGDSVTDWSEYVLGSDPFRTNSVRAALPIITSNGIVTGSVAGDYAAFVEQMRGGPAGTNNGITRAQAARFLQQATFGPTLRELDRVQQLGFAAWIDDQLTNQPATLHRKYIDHIHADFYGAHTERGYIYNEQDWYLYGLNCPTAFARGAVGGNDQLRQRVAFALSQICVASRRDPNLADRPLGMTDFYDIFVRNAFGNYLDVLREVTLHPAMGRYLSHIGNQKARPEINQYPDENYAREVQQLFSIGLWELNPDGSRQLDANGQPIPTYSNAQITEFARVFTGLWFGGQPWGSGGWADEHYTVPMEMWAEKHDFGAKTLFNGATIPARAATAENAMRDVDDALRNLFEHPNCGPFISRQLIQFLVTSNPSTNYVARVAAIFANNGNGKRGDLGAVVKAILLDSEARDVRWALGSPSFGRLKEPVQRTMAIARTAHLERHTNLLWWTWGDFNSAAFQEPGNSPSVFNFFRPGYQPPGLLTANGLVGPAFQIVDSYSSISFPNLLWHITVEGFLYSGYYDCPADYSDLMPLATDAPALVDQVNLLFCGGSMTATTRDNFLAIINQVPAYDAALRVRLAVYLAATSPEGAVQR